jgi:phycocyanobilin lyase subunit beta
MTSSYKAVMMEGKANQVSMLIEAVESADSSHALFAAVRNLAAATSEEAIPTLVAALSYNNPGAAVAAVNGLVRLGELAVPAIMAQLDLHNYTARAWAIRALAEIGDPRGWVILLEAATSDFALSVRRSATKGLGTLKWHWFPSQLLQQCQEESLAALLHIAQQDDEWVVRYAAIAGLQQLADGTMDAEWGLRSQIQSKLQQLLIHEQSLVVRSRILMAQQYLQSGKEQTLINTAPISSPLTERDWQLIQQRLDSFHRASSERTI